MPLEQTLRCFVEYDLVAPKKLESRPFRAPRYSPGAEPKARVRATTTTLLSMFTSPTGLNG